MIPFLDKFLSALGRKTSGGHKENETLSYIKVHHTQNWGSSEFELVEHPYDPSIPGIDAKITLGFAPFFGAELHIDLIDVLFTAANGPAPGLAQAIREAREAAAKGIGEKDSALQGSFHASVFLKGKGDLGVGQIELSRKPVDEKWTGTGNISGELGLTLGAEIKGKAQVYRVRGSLSAQGKATTKLIMGVETIPISEQTGDAKLKAKLEWDGLQIQYRGKAEFQAGIFSGSTSNSGFIPIFDKETLGEWTI